MIVIKSLHALPQNTARARARMARGYTPCARKISMVRIAVASTSRVNENARLYGFTST